MKLETTLEDAVKFRDHSQAIADTWNDIIERNAPPEAKINKPTQEDLDSLNWTKKTGAKGEYEQATNNDTKAFRTLQQYLQVQKGFSKLYGFSLWFHNKNENTIDRRG